MLADVFIWLKKGREKFSPKLIVVNIRREKQNIIKSEKFKKTGYGAKYALAA